jgi:hypothetical protein
MAGTLMTAAFDRPLTTDEKSLLLALATRTLADYAGSTHHVADEAMERLVAQGDIEIAGDSQTANVYVKDKLLVEARRDWLAFHAEFPGLIRANEFQERKS